VSKCSSDNLTLGGKQETMKVAGAFQKKYIVTNDEMNIG
jgi:hypothetical protein